MAFRRKPRKSFRRRFRRFRKTYRRRNAKASSNIHLFKRTKVDEHAITNAGFVAIKSDIADGTYNCFKLDELPNYTEFTALYDEYKICRIKCKFVFNRNTAEVASANAELPQLITVNDYNDITPLANEAEALQYKTFKSVRMDKPITRYFRPKVASPASTYIVPPRWAM